MALVVHAFHGSDHHAHDGTLCKARSAKRHRPGQSDAAGPRGSPHPHKTLSWERSSASQEGSQEGSQKGVKPDRTSDTSCNTNSDATRIPSSLHHEMGPIYLLVGFGRPSPPSELPRPARWLARKADFETLMNFDGIHRSIRPLCQRADSRRREVVHPMIV